MPMRICVAGSERENASDSRLLIDLDFGFGSAYELAGVNTTRWEIESCCKELKIHQCGP
ncbi:hypothetical protein D3C74_73680 [compost metagenome]